MQLFFLIMEQNHATFIKISLSSMEIHALVFSTWFGVTTTVRKEWIKVRPTEWMDEFLWAHVTWDEKFNANIDVEARNVGMGWNEKGWDGMDGMEEDGLLSFTVIDLFLEIVEFVKKLSQTSTPTNTPTNTPTTNTSQTNTPTNTSPTNTPTNTSTPSLKLN